MAITKENAWEIVDRAVRGNVITGIRDGNKVRILVPEQDHRKRQSIRDITRLCSIAFGLRLNKKGTQLIINCGYDPTDYIADHIAYRRETGNFSPGMPPTTQKTGLIPHQTL